MHTRQQCRIQGILSTVCAVLTFLIRLPRPLLSRLLHRVCNIFTSTYRTQSSLAGCGSTVIANITRLQLLLLSTLPISHFRSFLSVFDWRSWGFTCIFITIYSALHTYLETHMKRALTYFSLFCPARVAQETITHIYIHKYIHNSFINYGLRVKRSTTVRLFFFAQVGQSSSKEMPFALRCLLVSLPAPWTVLLNP